MNHRISQNIKTIRTENKLTQTEMGELLGVSQRTVCGYEKNNNVPEYIVDKIVKQFKVNKHDLIHSNITNKQFKRLRSRVNINVDPIKFSHNLSKLRKDSYISQRDLADAIGVSYSAISHYENGRRIPNKYALERIAKIFSTTPTKIGTTNMR